MVGPGRVEGGGWRLGLCILSIFSSIHRQEKKERKKERKRWQSIRVEQRAARTHMSLVTMHPSSSASPLAASSAWNASSFCGHGVFLNNIYIYERGWGGGSVELLSWWVGGWFVVCVCCFLGRGIIVKICVTDSPPRPRPPTAPNSRPTPLAD